ncbi:T6SS effector amidase Tae4 family protein [Taylorella equigenitalis]|uniref:T6SS effector amidase Tae4 family protein n=2 Tax=Taylorella equigenitalis TaxID=29575 RepID=UPI0030B87D1D
MAETIGGNLYLNFLKTDNTWKNTCAVRMSYILIFSGQKVPKIFNKTVSGLNNNWYFFRIADLVHYLTHTWGQPDIEISKPNVSNEILLNKWGF